MTVRYLSDRDGHRFVNEAGQTVVTVPESSPLFGPDHAFDIDALLDLGEAIALIADQLYDAQHGSQDGAQ